MQDLILPHRITSYECGADKLMKPECFQHFCQEMAEEHADSYGFGYDWVMTNRTAWVQVQGDFEMQRRPAWKEKVYLRTNTGKASALQAGRFVEMTDESGNVLARADLLWVIINFDTRRPVPLKRTGLPLDNPSPTVTESMDFPARPETAAATAELTAGRRDVDFNGHINNSAYLIWALDTLPADILKVDAAFTATVTTSRRREQMLRSIVGLAHALELDVVAEGVETEKQLNLLRNVGCNLVQGYYFSRPLPPEDFEALIEREININRGNQA